MTPAHLRAIALRLLRAASTRRLAAGVAFGRSLLTAWARRQSPLRHAAQALRLRRARAEITSRAATARLRHLTRRLHTTAHRATTLRHTTARQVATLRHTARQVATLRHTARRV
ncbi:hypothetical protein, partial [Rhizocola hellebori]|uniref:hypothetical protein n=1 Tax=Rhizocola hellebori TaxID=1392758 RepID=UPI00194407E6